MADHMESFGQLIRRLRKEKGEPLRTVASHLDIDQAVLSKLEKEKRKPSKALVIKLAKYFGMDEKEMLVAYLSDRILYDIDDDELATATLKVAEQKIAYRKTLKTARNTSSAK